MINQKISISKNLVLFSIIIITLSLVQIVYSDGEAATISDDEFALIKGSNGAGFATEKVALALERDPTLASSLERTATLDAVNYNPNLLTKTSSTTGTTGTITTTPVLARVMKDLQTDATPLADPNYAELRTGVLSAHNLADAEGTTPEIMQFDPAKGFLVGGERGGWIKAQNLPNTGLTATLNEDGSALFSNGAYFNGGGSGTLDVSRGTGVNLDQITMTASGKDSQVDCSLIQTTERTQVNANGGATIATAKGNYREDTGKGTLKATISKTGTIKDSAGNTVGTTSVTLESSLATTGSTPTGVTPAIASTRPGQQPKVAGFSLYDQSGNKDYDFQGKVEETMILSSATSDHAAQIESRLTLKENSRVGFYTSSTDEGVTTTGYAGTIKTDKDAVVGFRKLNEFGSGEEIPAEDFAALDTETGNINARLKSTKGVVEFSDIPEEKGLIIHEMGTGASAALKLNEKDSISIRGGKLEPSNGAFLHMKNDLWVNLDQADGKVNSYVFDYTYTPEEKAEGTTTKVDELGRTTWWGRKIPPATHSESWSEITTPESRTLTISKAVTDSNGPSSASFETLYENTVTDYIAPAKSKNIFETNPAKLLSAGASTPKLNQAVENNYANNLVNGKQASAARTVLNDPKSSPEAIVGALNSLASLGAPFAQEAKQRPCPTGYTRDAAGKCVINKK
jgi:hypothetical protein